MTEKTTNLREQTVACITSSLVENDVVKVTFTDKAPKTKEFKKLIAAIDEQKIIVSVNDYAYLLAAERSLEWCKDTHKTISFIFLTDIDPTEFANDLYSIFVSVTNRFAYVDSDTMLFMRSLVYRATQDHKVIEIIFSNDEQGLACVSIILDLIKGDHIKLRPNDVLNLMDVERYKTFATHFDDDEDYFSARIFNIVIVDDGMFRGFNKFPFKGLTSLTFSRQTVDSVIPQKKF